MDQATSNYILIITGIIAIIAELLLGVVTGFDLLIIGVIAIIAGSVGLAFSSFTTALIFTIVLAFVYVVFGRRLVKQKISITTTATNTDALIGKKGIVTQKIMVHKPGQVKVDGEIWRASSKTTIDEGSSVKVESVSGVTLGVTLSS